MNTECQLQYIKPIPIADYLGSLGIQSVKRYGGYALYHAPYRDDHNSSHKVNFARNLWYDFGLCRGGSIIDLVMLLKGCDIHKALAKLTRGATFSFHSPVSSQQARAEQKLIPPTTARCVLTISKNLAPYLQQYLQEKRGIALYLAKPYLRAITYAIGKRTYAAFGFPNQATGYELRDAKTFKGTIAPKDISVIADIEPMNRSTSDQLIYNLFEGLIDFLSYLTVKGKKTTSASIVLNSVGNIHKALAYLRKHHVSKVQAFMDNDEAKQKVFDNQVRALRFILSGSHEEMLRFEKEGRLGEWCDASIDWLRQTFGTENVVAATLHADEETLHIHATVVPLVQGERRKAKEKADRGKRK